jgi:hypothetical protein
MSAVWRARRCRPGDVEHLELWCEETPSGPLWREVGSDRAEALRRAGATFAEVALELARALAPVLVRVAAEQRCERVYVAGGLSSLDGMGRLLARETGLPVALDPEGSFAGIRGGHVLLRQTGSPGAVVDVGQTAIKAACGERRVVHPRDFQALPRLYIDPERPPPSDPGRGTRAASFVAGACVEVLAGAPDAPLLLALPGPMDEVLLPGPCSYGWQGDASFFPALLSLLDERLPGGGELLVLNDAELAAESARERLSPGPGERVLCVTLGFGPGGAVLAPE